MAHQVVMMAMIVMMAVMMAVMTARLLLIPNTIALRLLALVATLGPQSPMAVMIVTRYSCLRT